MSDRAFISADTKEWHVADDRLLVPRCKAVINVGHRVALIGEKADHRRFAKRFSVCGVCAPDLQPKSSIQEPSTAEAVAYAMSHGEEYPHRRTE